MKTDIRKKIWNGSFFPFLSLSLQLFCEEPNQRKVGPQSGRDMVSQLERLSNTKRNGREEEDGGAVQQTHYLLSQSKTWPDRETSSSSEREAGSAKKKIKMTQPDCRQKTEAAACLCAC